MIFAEVINLLLITLIHSPIIGKKWIYLKSIHGSMPMIRLNKRKFLSKKRHSNSFLALSTILMKFEVETWEPSHCQTLRKAFSEVRREESRKCAILGKSESVSTFLIAFVLASVVLTQWYKVTKSKNN